MPLQPIPILENTTNLQENNVPDFEGATKELAASQNSLSQIGATVAQSASNQLATQLGTEQGKTPIGDLLPPITDFDKHFAESYNAQANATLSLQGQKLLDDVQVAVTKKARLTPDFLANVQDQLKTGLSKIAAQAPTAIKTDLQAQFDSHTLSQMTEYNERMFRENREDNKNNLDNGIDLNIKNAYQAYTTGDKKAGDIASANANSMIDNALASRFKTPEEARALKETVKQTAINGQFIQQATAAQQNGTLPQFEKDFADRKLPGSESLTTEQHTNAGKAVEEQIEFLQRMRSQDQNLQAQNMLNRIAMDPTKISATDWTNFTNSVSPDKAAQVEFHFIQALKRNQNNTAGVNTLLNNWANPELHAQAPEKVKNAAYLQMVDYAVQNSQNKLPEIKPLSHEDAEVQVAATAGGPIPVFINELKNKLHSSNPAMIESAANQIHSLQQMQAGHAIAGINDQDKAIYTAYEALRDSRDPQTAARDATTAVLNQDPDVQQQNKEKWQNLVSTATKGTGIAPSEWALNAFNMKTDVFQNPSTAQVYGTDILNKYRNFYQLLNGDENSAKKLTQQYINDNYGQTGVNGGSYTTLHPIEKVLGYQDSSAVPFIQQDVINQIQPKLQAIKSLYDQGKSNEYWEVQPLSNKTHGIFTTTYDPIQMKQVIRDGNSIKTNTYNVALLGNAFDSWDVAIQTDSGMRNLFQTAPFLGIMSIQPNAKWIRDNYNKVHSLK